MTAEAQIKKKVLEQTKESKGRKVRQAHYFKLTFHNTDLNCFEAGAQAVSPAAAGISKIKCSLKAKLNGEKYAFSAYLSKRPNKF